MVGWRVIGRPGRLGRLRRQRTSEWNREFGSGGWRLAWLIRGRYHDHDESLRLYENAYFEVLRQNGELRDALVRTARDVYVNDPSEVGSGLDYRIQTGDSQHLEDIAIRRCLVRLGEWFVGRELIRLGGVDRDPAPSRLRAALSVHGLRFHRPELIIHPELEGWWLPGTVESFYQSNKFLLARTG
jgi:hypothetical protein